MGTTVFYLLMLQKYIKISPLCLGNISRDLSANNTKETG